MTDESKQEPDFAFISKFLLAMILLVINSFLIMVLWNGYLVVVFPAIKSVTYLQAMAIGLLGKAIFARVP